MSILLTRVIIKVIVVITATVVRIWIAICSFYYTLPSPTLLGSYEFSFYSTYRYSYDTLKP